MKTPTVRILNCRLDNLTFDELMGSFDRGVLVPTNVDMMVKLQKNKAFYDAYTAADYKVNDSRVVGIISAIIGRPLRATISGSDFFPAFYQFHRNDPSVKIFLLGAKDGIARKALEKINAKVNRPIVVGEYSPPFGFENDASIGNQIVEKVNRSGATVLAVGLGAPKQEIWIDRYKNLMPGIQRFLCIGATIDFEAGAIPRAPSFLRRTGFEWFYRLLKEPRRLWRRYMVEDMRFFYLIFIDFLHLYSNPFEGGEQ